jgi:undecaprenyl-diphosphatase
MYANACPRDLLSVFATVGREEETWVNYRLFRSINDLTGNATVDASMKFAARYLIFAVFLLLAFLCVRRLFDRQFRPVLLTAATLGLTFLLGLAESATYAEKRPFETHRVHQLVAHSPGQSFPSDHATAAFGVALAVLAFLSWRWGTSLLIAALLIGFARVYDGIHYPLDIAGGLAAAAVAVGATLIVARLTRRRHPDYQRRRVGVANLELPIR